MELTNDEKKIILSQHIKNISTNIYNLDLSLLAENSLESPDTNIISNLEEQIQKEQIKKSSLLEKYEELENL